MPKRKKQPKQPRRVSIRSQLRAEPDLRKIAGAVIALAIAQAEAEAAAQQQRAETTDADS